MPAFISFATFSYLVVTNILTFTLDCCNGTLSNSSHTFPLQTSSKTRKRL
ncbi:hypothetical protein MA16_Dca010073 [Dendrobium catenatum]|uniref:Uncharacterized protein n=1 Tax=Dendrobium catenatum TaxID=906689 RepID=A0A2I0X709_9ASPA|nr:hypothetical protein MA16_Dca010073 [Dendrobium catenatum]